MAVDKRLELVERMERYLITKYDKQLCDDIANELVMIINDYEIMNRTTEIALLDTDVNEELLNMYVASLLTSGKSLRTVKGYRRQLKHFSDFVKKPFTECDTLDFRRYLASYVKKQRKSSTVSNVRNYLSAFFIWMNREGITPENKMLKIDTVKIEKIIEEPLSEVEIAVIRDNTRNSYERAVFEFLISTGVRVNELSNLKISDVNFVERTVHVRDGKGGKDRFTYVTPVCINYLTEYLNTRKHQSEYLFINPRGGTKTNAGGVRNRIKNIGKRCNIMRIHPHLLRKTFATRLVDAGMDVSFVKFLLGHEDLNTTQRYVKSNSATVKNAYFQYALN